MRNTTGNDGTAPVPRRSGGAGLFAVPRRAGLVADPSKAWVLDAHTAQVLSNTPIGVLVQALCRFVEPAITAQQSDLPNGDSCRSVDSAKVLPDLDDLIEVGEAAQTLHVEREWLIRNAPRLPFV